MINKLNFATVKEAYTIPSTQIKNRQDEIDKLKKIIFENSDINKSNKYRSTSNSMSNMSNSTNMNNSTSNMSNSTSTSNSNIMNDSMNDIMGSNSMGGNSNIMGGNSNIMGGNSNIMGGNSNIMGGNSNIMGSNSNIMGSNSMNNNAQSEDFEYLFYKLASNPKFDQVVQNYVILKHPEWLNQSNQMNQMYVPMNQSNQMNQMYVPMNQMNQVNRMNQMSRSNFGNFNNDDVKHYILFFVFSVIIYLILGLLVKK